MKLSALVPNWIKFRKHTKITSINKPNPSYSPNLPGGTPSGRSSVRVTPELSINGLTGISFVPQHKLMTLIPIVREACVIDRNMGLALHDLTLLANTGFTIDFDPGVSPEERDKMRKDVDLASKEWIEGGSGLHNITNKFFAQIILGGAISAEWVPKKNLKDGIDYIALVNPEEILFGLNKSRGRYEPYQRPTVNYNLTTTNSLNPIKLNQATYRYLGFLGDTDLPYGVPLFLTALKDLETQENMGDSIKFIMEQFGLAGFAELLIKKPAQQQNENNTAYRGRLEKLLKESKKAILSGVKDGVVVGFDEDHKYNFNSTTKNLSGIAEVFDLNQRLLSNGLKYNTAFMGGGDGGSDTFVTIIFTKLLSQLSNLQANAAAMLEFGINLHLRLKGYNYDYIKVKFLPSTITDELKVQQANEINQRVSHALRVDGIIDQDQYAERMGYASPAEDEPIVDFEDQAGVRQDTADGTDPAQKDKNNKDKAKSDRKGRDKKASQPKRGDQDSKPR